MKYQSGSRKSQIVLAENIVLSFSPPKDNSLLAENWWALVDNYRTLDSPCWAVVAWFMAVQQLSRKGTLAEPNKRRF